MTFSKLSLPNFRSSTCVKSYQHKRLTFIYENLQLNLEEATHSDNISHIHDFKTVLSVILVLSAAPGATKISMVVASWLGEVIR